MTQETKDPIEELLDEVNNNTAEPEGEPSIEDGYIRITSGDIPPSIVAAQSLIGQDQIGYKTALQIANVIISLEEEKKKIVILERHIMGGRNGIRPGDPDFEEIIYKMKEISENTCDIKITPIKSDDLAKGDVKISPPALAVLKGAGLLV